MRPACFLIALAIGNAPESNEDAPKEFVPAIQGIDRLLDCTPSSSVPEPKG